MTNSKILARLMVGTFAVVGCLMAAGTVTPAKAVVWTETHQWGPADNDAFSKFIATVPMDIFTAEIDPISKKGPNPWKGIATDCADAAYSLRVIFSYLNKLPVDFYNQNSAELRNSTNLFDKYEDEIKRVRRFLAYVATNTNTDTIVQDTYPVKITRDYVRGGALFVHPQGDEKIHITYRPGHVYYLRDVAKNGLITYFSSTTPSMVRELDLRFGITFAPFYTTSGYRAWKWPGVDVKNMPGYSEEQFHFAGWYPNSFTDENLPVTWQHAIQKRVSTRPMSLEEEMDAGAKNVVSAMKERAFIIQDAWKFYQAKYKGQGCMSKEDYSGYSTPTRDVKLRVELENLNVMANQVATQISQQSWWNQDGVRYKALHDIFARYKVEILPGKVVTVDQVRDAFITEKVLAISEPEHSPEVRWGLADLKKWTCPDRRKQYRGGE